MADEICANCGKVGREHFAVPFAPEASYDMRGTMGNSFRYRYICPNSIWTPTVSRQEETR